MLPRVGWYLDVKTITVYYVCVFFFFQLVTLTSETPLNPKGRYVSVVKALHFPFFFFFFGIHPPKTLSVNLRHSHKVFSFDLVMCGPVGQV